MPVPRNSAGGAPLDAWFDEKKNPAARTATHTTATAIALMGKGFAATAADGAAASRVGGGCGLGLRFFATGWCYARMRSLADRFADGLADFLGSCRRSKGLKVCRDAAAVEYALHGVFDRLGLGR